MDALKPDDESVDTPLVSPFLDSDDDSDDGEVLNELEEYGNAGKLCRQRVINSLDGDDLALQCMIGFIKFVAYFDPFLPMNIITCKAYNTIMVEGLDSTRRNLVAIVRDVYVFVGSFTYITDFVVLEDIREFILRDMAKVVMVKPFRKVTKLEYDYAKGLMSFIRIFDNYTFQMPCTIPSGGGLILYQAYGNLYATTGKKHGMMMLDSIDNGPLVYPTVEENGQTRPKKYFELTKAQQLQDDCDVQATNIILYGLPPDVYALVNHQEAAKDI
ncbi:hypothetical protein Tco_0819489 [Tanacetum coccineum]|uniref:Uncharacterized protein n=1 Tax=Tanacetum coccineum TaxID=301880 RepID=A0ABQ5A6Q6_9ASTR